MPITIENVKITPDDFLSLAHTEQIMQNKVKLTFQIKPKNAPLHRVEGIINVYFKGNCEKYPINIPFSGIQE
jgi:hypothetical protein